MEPKNVNWASGAIGAKDLKILSMPWECVWSFLTPSSDSLLPPPGHMPGNVVTITRENFRLITVTLPRFKNALGKE